MRDSLERYKKGVNLFSRGDLEGFRRYVSSLKGVDELARKALEGFYLARLGNPEKALRKIRAVLPEVQAEPGFLLKLHLELSTIYRILGDLNLAENYARKYRELCLRVCKKYDYVADVELLIAAALKGDFQRVRKEAPGLLRMPVSREQRGILTLLLAFAHVSYYDVHKGLELLDEIIQEHWKYMGPSNLPHIWEFKGIGLRVAGRLEESQEAFLKGMDLGLEKGVKGAADACVRALENAKFGGLPQPEASKLRSAIRLARGSNELALKEIKALLSDDPEGLLDASEAFLRYSHGYEAVYTALLFLRLFRERKLERGLWRALEVLRSLSRSFRNLQHDPLVGPTFRIFKPLIEAQPQEGLRARLLGELRLWVNGREVDTRGWRNRKALLLLVYLLLVPQHRLRRDYLLYLLWPEELDKERARLRLRVAASYLRKRLGEPGLLVYRGGFYELQRARTDLDELREGLASGAFLDPGEVERLELLPEFDDPYVQEHRRHFGRLKEEILEKA